MTAGHAIYCDFGGPQNRRRAVRIEVYRYDGRLVINLWNRDSVSFITHPNFDKEKENSGDWDVGIVHFPGPPVSPYRPFPQYLRLPSSTPPLVGLRLGIPCYPAINGSQSTVLYDFDTDIDVYLSPSRPDATTKQVLATTSGIKTYRGMSGAPLVAASGTSFGVFWEGSPVARYVYLNPTWVRWIMSKM